MKTNIEESERICAAATPGPLISTPAKSVIARVTMEPYRPDMTIARFERDVDAKMFIHASTALPQALAELRELRADRDHWIEQANGYREALANLEDDPHGALRAENERLREKLREVGIGLAQEY